MVWFTKLQARILSLVFFAGFVSAFWGLCLNSESGSWGDRLGVAGRVSLCLLFAATIHLTLARNNLLESLNRPLNRSLLGENKKWRGLVVEPLMGIPTVWLMQRVESWAALDTMLALDAKNPVFLGIFLGLGRILGELPNSFLKRRLGIKPGTHPSRGRIWVALYDQGDSAIPIMMGLGIWYGLPPMEWVWQIGLLTLALFFGRLFLFGVGLKQSPLT